MDELWERTRDHEAGHAVVAWLLGDRPTVIAGVTVNKEKGQLVARTHVRSGKEHISADGLSKVGLAGLLAEAKGAVERIHKKSSFRPMDGLATAVMKCVLEYVDGRIPEEGGWRLGVDVAPEEKLTPAILTTDDVIYLGATVGIDTPKAKTMLDEVGERLSSGDVWEAVKTIAAAIGAKARSDLYEDELREILSQKLPRAW
jgi:hypothetical protein